MENNNEISLSYAEKFFNFGDMMKSLKILTKLEEGEEISPKEKCSIYLLKSKIYNFLCQFDKGLQFADNAYHKSQVLDDNLLIIDALLLKAEHALMMGEKKEYFELLTETEEIFKRSSREKQLRKADILFIKGQYFRRIEGDLTQALDFNEESLEIYKKVNNKHKIAEVYIEIARLMFYKGELDKSVIYIKESLKLNEEIGNKRGITASYSGFAVIYSLTENLQKSLEYLEKCLAIAEEINYKYYIATSLVNIGEIFYVQGELKRAGIYYKKSLEMNLEIQDFVTQGYVLLDLIILFLDMNNLEKAKFHFSSLEELYQQHLNFKEIDEYYQVAKALILKTSTRMHDHGEAEEIFKEIANKGSTDFQLRIIALLSWCELLLHELSLSNDPEVLKEIQPLITKLLHIVEQQYNYESIAKVYLLQAKLALVQFELKKAQQFLTQAQQIAQQKNLQLLAMKISAEHDELLNQFDLWESLIQRQNQISMAERIKFAKLDGPIGSMVRKRETKQQILMPEKPLFLTIMTQGGVPLIKLPFLDNWADNDIFSGFISTFNVFSTTIFSKSVDRVKMGEYKILFKSLEPFIVCYVIQGQSYLAQQKLTRFSDRVRTTHEIWDRLQNSIKTGETLKGNRIPHLQTLINEIFDKSIVFL